MDLVLYVGSEEWRLQFNMTLDYKFQPHPYCHQCGKKFDYGYIKRTDYPFVGYELYGNNWILQQGQLENYNRLYIMCFSCIDLVSRGMKCEYRQATKSPGSSKLFEYVDKYPDIIVIQGNKWFIALNGKISARIISPKPYCIGCGHLFDVGYHNYIKAADFDIYDMSFWKKNEHNVDWGLHPDFSLGIFDKTSFLCLTCITAQWVDANKEQQEG